MDSYYAVFVLKLQNTIYELLKQSSFLG